MSTTEYTPKPASPHSELHAPGAPVAPHPGSREMPPWDVAELVDAPVFHLKNWAGLLGPALLMGGAAIGGGEWLLGPTVTARYGGALMWLATLSILGQVLYNIEISRYTLYTGEPIFTGKFRTLPGPRFWLMMYLILDFGAVFPYLAASAATPVTAMWLRRMPLAGDPGEESLRKMISVGIFILAFVPLIFGGKVYNSLKAVMSFKIVTVLGFLLILGTLYARPATWVEIFTGFVKIGNVPIQRDEDLNKNGVLDPGEDWDGDNHLDVVEPDTNKNGKLDPEEDFDHDGRRDGDNIVNVFASMWSGQGFPKIDLSMIAYLAAFAAIAGSGGLSNTPTSNYTRDQGWGMGHHVGAIPSVVGGHNIQLSHVGSVFLVTPETVPRWKRWVNHVRRDQLVVWMPACFLGMALPSMLSVEFLPRGVAVDAKTAAGMTAGGVRDHVAAVSGATVGDIFWYLTLFCGFLVLTPTVSSTADGFIRRWVDVFWTSSKYLRSLDTNKIKVVYFSVLCGYLGFGLVMLYFFEPGPLVKIATNIMNFALGFSCWHTLVINTVLLPRELRPSWLIRFGLFLAGCFFWTLATLTSLKELGYL